MLSFTFCFSHCRVLYNVVSYWAALQMMVHSVCFTPVVIVDLLFLFNVLSQFVPSVTKLKKKASNIRIDYLSI